MSSEIKLLNSKMEDPTENGKDFGGQNWKKKTAFNTVA